MYAGIDLGSTSIKAVVLGENQQIVGLSIMAAGSDYRAGGEKILAEALTDASCSWEDLKSRITTGYGRYTVGEETTAVSEITCCGRGVGVLAPKAGLIIDIGGQDCKAIRINPGGKVRSFALNDKCAAGTGRFLERIAVSLGIDLSRMVALSLSAKDSLPVSSTCTVFAETEVISRVSAGEPLGSIVRGLHVALANRIATLVKRVGMVEGDTLICGGGAKNAALVNEIEKIVGKLSLPNQLDPRFIPAIGAAIIARERYLAGEKTMEN